MSRWPRAERSRALRRWTWLLPMTAFAIVGCQNDPLPTEPVLETELGSLTASVQDAGIGADDWIVVFREGTQDPPGLANRLVAEHGGTIRYTYQHVLKGFAGSIPSQAIEGIRNNPNVDYIERDGIVTKTAVGSWGLDRIDQRALPLDGSYTPTGTGAGVDTWIIDTGLDYGRTDEFGSRFDTTRDYDFVSGDDDASDCDGHGTHVAGTVGSDTYGVAKGVTIIGVRVLNCAGSGTWSGVIAGIDYVAANKSGPTVANMSLGGGKNSSLNTAVANAVGAGVVMAVAAGNEDTDACSRSPASAPDAITVAASTSSDARSWFSNYGSCVDLFAPGSGITSTANRGGTATWSGTSMASPHVAGAAALLLEANPGWSPTQVWAEMQADATTGAISDTAGSPNMLLGVKTVDGGPPGCGSDCPPVDVQWVSAVTVNTNNGNRAGGSVMVQIVDSEGPVEGASVSGPWTVNGVEDYTTSTGTTGPDGTVELSTGMIRNATTFNFCVTGLSASGYESGPTGQCAGFGAPLTGPAVPPADLTAARVKKGRNWRVELGWTGGSSIVEVKRNGSPLATVSNSGSYVDSHGKTPTPGTYDYQVCSAGTTDCTGTVQITF